MKMKITILTVHKGEVGKETEKVSVLLTLTFGHAGSHIPIHRSVPMIE